MADVDGDMRGYNLYAYCFNNSIMYTDHNGNWPKWLEKIGKSISNFFVDVYKSVEARVGFGNGIGFNASNNIKAELSRDTYVGFDDGEIITGNVITSEISIFDSRISIGDTYDYLVEKGGNRISDSGSPGDDPFDMNNYPDVTHGNEWSIWLVSKNSNGDYLIYLSKSVHFIFGGHVSIAFNVSEFRRRLSA